MMTATMDQLISWNNKVNTNNFINFGSSYIQNYSNLNRKLTR